MLCVMWGCNGTFSAQLPDHHLPRPGVSGFSGLGCATVGPQATAAVSALEEGESGEPPCFSPALSAVCQDPWGFRKNADAVSVDLGDLRCCISNRLLPRAVLRSHFESQWRGPQNKGVMLGAREPVLEAKE